MIEARTSKAIGYFGLLTLAALAAGSLAPLGEYFLGNFAVYWLPIAIVLTILAVTGAGLGVSAGSAVVLTAFLFGYHAWAQSVKSHEWVWGGYLFAMPGAAIGGLVASFLRRRRSLALVVAALVAFAATAIGLVLNTGLLCVTLIHCLG